MLAEELRIARQAAGLSQEMVGRAVGVSGAHVARLERAAVPGASVALFSRLFAVLGMRLSARPYPEGPPVRDAAHARLLERFRAELPPGTSFRTEVPLGRGSDMRAWDAEIQAADGSCKLEAETVLADLQATERRIALNMADDDVERVILLVADTHRNRRVLREFRELLRARFPLDTRSVLREVRAGRLPDQSGIVLR
jgi:transcriptional regulator with XRE-family HTH domain